jgi:branched-chain amino acid transport system ATP-binding protein
MSLLEARGLHKRYGGVHAVDDVTFHVDEGERVALIGPNGAGKSTCFNLIGGQVRPDEGAVTLAGEDIRALPPRERFRRGVGRTFQITATFASMSVVENVQVALLSHRGEALRPWSAATGRHRDEARELLAQVGLADQAERSCAQIAYGDLKRLELAVALANRPRLLLMDEPTAGMAPRERHALMELVTRLVAASRVAVLFTEHDMDIVFGHADRLLVLDRGRLVAQGDPEAVRRDPQVKAIYLGYDEALPSGASA